MTATSEAHDFLADTLRTLERPSQTHTQETAQERAWQVARYLGPRLVEDQLFQHNLKVQQFLNRSLFRGSNLVFGSGMSVVSQYKPTERGEWRPGDVAHYDSTYLRMGIHARTDSVAKGVYMDDQGVLFGYNLTNVYLSENGETVNVTGETTESPVRSYVPEQHQIPATEVLDGLVTVAWRNYQPDQAGVLVPLQRTHTPPWA